MDLPITKNASEFSGKIKISNHLQKTTVKAGTGRNDLQFISYLEMFEILQMNQL